jgi:hypothetical protein
MKIEIQMLNEKRIPTEGRQVEVDVSVSWETVLEALNSKGYFNENEYESIDSGIITEKGIRFQSSNSTSKEHPNGFFGWVSYPEGGCKSLKEAVRMWRFECSENEEGLDIEYFTGEKWSSDEPLFFEAIAPFVKNGEIACTGEDGEKWRYLFENGDVKEQYAVITWADY